MSEVVRDMFADIADRYDTTNTVLSFGVHHLWRRRAVKESGLAPGGSALDCATGTGDLAIALKRAVGAQGRVVGTDFCAEMLAHAPTKAGRAGLDIEWEVADAMHLQYPADSFDVASIAFGIRNVDDPVVALRSMARCVRPGGRVVVLEFGQPNGAFGAMYRWYSDNVIPAIGGAITGKPEAYSYLNETSSAFPAGDDFLALMDEAGSFASRRGIPMTGGICWLYVGEVAG